MIVLNNPVPGQFVFVQINSPAKREKLIEQIEKDGLNNPHAVANFSQLPQNNPPLKILELFLADHPNCKTLFIDGMEEFFRDERRAASLEALNLARESLGDLPVSLVFLLPELLVQAIRHGAQNFWNWRAYDFYLDTPGSEMETQQISMPLTSDLSPPPGDTPEARARRIRILKSLLEDGQKEGRTMESLAPSTIFPLVKDLFISGKFDEAEKYLKELLNLKIDREGVPVVSGAYNLMGEIFRAKGQYDQAIEYLEKALEINLKIYGVDHPSVADLWDNLGRAWDIKGEYDKALAYTEKALDSHLKTFGADHHSVARLWNNLGEVWRAKGEYDKAIEFYEKALKNNLKTFGPEHPNVATVWNNLGISWRAKGEYDQAIKYFEKALESDFKTYGADHPNLARLWNNLGTTWMPKGQYDLAIEFFEKALESDFKTYGADHPNMARLWNNLGATWNAKGQYDLAIEFYEKALESEIKTFGADHPNVASLWNNLGMTWGVKGDNKKARVYIERARAIWQNAGLGYQVRLAEDNLRKFPKD